MIKFYLSFLFTFFVPALFAQTKGTVKGIVQDANSKETISSATISVLDKKDSSLVSFTMTDSKGSFEMKSLPSGDFRLMITHINYHNKAISFSINDSNKVKDLGNIFLGDKNTTLDEVVVTKEEPPVTLLGDTVQYNAGSFKTAPNASVEQLLKKLPGMEVDKDGTVKAQGEKVTRVLVDGKEFFGNDPKMATKNLPADAIDKVQVYDKQSEQAQLTGFEDGNYEKTINLKLKKDKKKGIFGKASLGGGTNERVEGRFNVNSFKGARQMSLIGMGNNTNAEGFSFMDIINFNGGIGKMMGSGNSITLSGTDAAAMGGGSKNGINTIWGSGLNYNNIIGSKLDLQSSYFYNHYNPDLESHTQRQYLMPGFSNIYNQNVFSNNVNNSQRVNLNLLYQIDSFNSVRITPNISFQNTRNQSRSDYQTLSTDGIKVNDGITNSSNNSEGYNFKNEIMFRKKFRQRGRTFSATLQTNFNGSNSDGKQLSFNDFYKSGNIISKDTINQYNTTDGSLKSYTVRLVYTEPIFKQSLLEFNVNKSNSINISDVTTYDYNILNSKYDLFNDSLTNNFRNTYGFTNAGLRLRTQKNQYSYSVGINWQQADLQGKVISGSKDSVIAKTFYNLLWNARFQYNISKFRTFTITYNTNTNQPTMQQLQPVPDISNPLYIREGNPNLKQEYTHTLQTNLKLVRPYENKNLFLFLTLQSTQNKIVNSDSLDMVSGKRSSHPVNVNGVYNVSGSVTYSVPVSFLKGTVELGNRTAFYKGKQFINSVGNDIKTVSFSPGVRLNLNPTAKLNVMAGYKITYNNTRYSIQSDINTQYFIHEYNTSVEWELPKGIFFATDFTYLINTQKTSGFNTKIPIWNASISKQVLNFNRGEIKLSASDLLNQNIGISRNTNQNYIEDIRVKTLPRFFLLSFTYSLTKTGLNKTGSGGMRIMMK